MTEYGRNLETARAFNIHEEAVGILYKTLKFVCTGFHLDSWIQKIGRHWEYW